MNFCSAPSGVKMAANLLIHIPHASLCLPPDFWCDVTVDRKIIEKDLRFMADYKVDELARDIDCHKVIVKYSRLYCDVEWFQNDADEPMARLGMGAVYTYLPGGAQYRQVTPERREEIIRQAYEPHHAQLNKWFSGNDALRLKSYTERLGYSCALNYPYAGALVSMDFYRDKKPGLRSVMWEINRRVYLEGETVREEAARGINKIIKFIASDNFYRSNS